MKLTNIIVGLGVVAQAFISKVMAINTTDLAKISAVGTQTNDAMTSWAFCSQLLTDRTEGLLSYDEFYTEEHLIEYNQVYQCINNAPKESVFFDNLALRDRDTRRWLDEYMSKFSADDIQLVILGGSSGYERAGEKYNKLLLTLKGLIEEGFKRDIKIHVMGGAGPDAMEAAGVGPWLSGRSEGDTAAAIAGLAQVPKYVEHDWIKTGIEGREKYPRMLPGENLAITTYAYAYSPPMPYADVYASFSTDMIRGYEMLTRTKVRLIMPGGKGTFLEKSMDDLLRTYNKCCSDTVTIFFDSKFWKKNLSPIMLSENLHFADTPEEVISHVLDHMSLAASQSSHPECANDDTAQSNSYRI